MAHRAATYGIGPDTWTELLVLQGGRCAICRKHSLDRAPAVDHDHVTGAVRGALCKRCNHDLLGAAFDSARVLAAALVYLLAPPASGSWVAPEDVGDAVLDAVQAVLERQGPQVR